MAIPKLVSEVSDASRFALIMRVNGYARAITNFPFFSLKSSGAGAGISFLLGTTLGRTES
jgi:hypothetical protein